MSFRFRQTPEHIDRRRLALKTFWRKRRDLYKKIALENTPDSVLRIEIIDKKRKEHEGIAFANRGVMAIPRPTSVYRLWVFLHECHHMERYDPFRARHYEEFLAEKFALETIEAAGITVPFWLYFQSRSYIKHLIEEDEAGGRFIDPRAAEYAGHKPKPYVLDEEKKEKILAQLRALEAQPRISDSDFEKIEAIRREYRERRE
jgi:hypothetical protein